MRASGNAEIAVIGAGVVGMTIALRLAQAGHEVVVLDPEAPGSGCSYGNAGTIADYAVMPVGTPEVLRALPALLFNRNSPLAIRRAALPALAPWLWRFLRQSLPGPAARNAHALARLLADAATRWRALAAECGAAAVLQDRGCLYAYATAADFEAAARAMAARHRLGVTVDLLDGRALTMLEPALRGMAGAAFFPGALFLSDPGVMMAALARRMLAAGVAHRRARVTALQRTGPGVRLATSDGAMINTRRVILCAGAQSRALARMAGDAVPLETERGYHAEWDMATPRLSRPACPVARGFYLCPMTGRLRVAGTVELGGLAAPASVHRIARLVEGARAVFPDLGPPDRTWLGFRPSLPDSLPVIGPSRGGAEVVHAFGHGHLGVTLAPVTASLVLAIIQGATPEIDLAPFQATRF